MRLKKKSIIYLLGAFTLIASPALVTSCGSSQSMNDKDDKNDNNNKPGGGSKSDDNGRNDDPNDRD